MTGPRRVRIARLGTDGMTALLRGDLAAASEVIGTPVSTYLASDRCTWLWRLRLGEIAVNPAAADWVAGAVVDVATGQVVGHAGFHAPPDAEGRVEVAYTTDPAYRRRGYARAALLALLARADAEPSVRTVRASVSPDNAASLATIAGLGFEHAGEQWDDEDGLELLFDRPSQRPGFRRGGGARTQ
jgi:RimJ/RimL family protein N-acetyltransferase